MVVVKELGTCACVAVDGSTLFSEKQACSLERGEMGREGKLEVSCTDGPKAPEIIALPRGHAADFCYHRMALLESMLHISS